MPLFTQHSRETWRWRDRRNVFHTHGNETVKVKVEERTKQEKVRTLCDDEATLVSVRESSRYPYVGGPTYVFFSDHFFRLFSLNELGCHF